MNLIDLNRDVFLKITQYLKSTSLRNYIGISEETFQWTSHIHYALYRLKCDQLPLQVLKSKQCKHQISGRVIIFNSNSSEGIGLRERIFEDIFEMKYKYNIPNIMIIGIFGERINDIVLKLYINQYGMDTFRVYNLYTGQQTLSLYSQREEGKATHIHENDVLTFILNMLPNQDCAYYYINDIMSRNIISNITHTPKRIGLAGAQFSITMISMKRLRFAPIQHHIKYEYFNSNEVSLLRNYDLNSSYFGSYIKCY